MHRMRPLIVGYSNPYQGVPALSPAVPNSAGWRLWKMMRDFCGVTQTEYLDMFYFSNVEDHPNCVWHATVGRDKESTSAMVLLGEQVRQAVNRWGRVEKILIHPQIFCGKEIRLIPHPSGRNLFYNDQTNRDLVAMMLEDLSMRGKS